MAAFFFLVYLAFGVVFLTTLLLWRGWRGQGGRTLNPYLPLAIVLTIAGFYLLAKLMYEEIYPCAVVDRQYCDFTSTQYHNLFDWDF
jgi:hypothetical protein